MKGDLELQVVLDEAEPGSIIVVKAEGASEAKMEEIRDALEEQVGTGVGVLVTNIDLEISLLSQEQAADLYARLEEVLSEAPDPIEDFS